MKSSLIQQLEDEKSIKWYNGLSKNDQESVEYVYDSFRNWANKIIDDPDAVNLNDGHPFAVGYAVGSSITEKKDPSDIDILIATNIEVYDCRLRMRHDERFLLKTLGDRMSEKRIIRIDNSVSSRYNDESSCRLLMHIDPKNSEQNIKPIDLIYQYAMPNKNVWETHDKKHKLHGFPSLHLFELGDSEKNIIVEPDHTSGRRLF